MASLVDEIWNSHIIDEIKDFDVLYIDKLFLHDLTSLRAFQNVINAGRTAFQPENVFVIPDHIPQCSTDRNSLQLKKQIKEHSRKLRLNYIDYDDKNYGIIHIVIDKLGYDLKNMLIAGGDSHMPTAGALSSLAFTIGTKDIERVLLNQSLPLKKPGNVSIVLEGIKNKNATEFDIMLYLMDVFRHGILIGKIVELYGSFIQSISLDAKKTICGFFNELGAFSTIINDSLVLPQEISDLPSFKINISKVLPRVTFGTSPTFSVEINETIPLFTSKDFGVSYNDYASSLAYMNFKEGELIDGLEIQKVFIGSCLGGKHKDIAEAEEIIRGQKVAPNVRAFLAPGSNNIYHQLAESGELESFVKAGFEILRPGCSMCSTIGNVEINPFDYIVSTSSRNEESRQGKNVRTILASPKSAAHFALEGRVFKYY